jgi:hypothetical protein
MIRLDNLRAQFRGAREALQREPDPRPSVHAAELDANRSQFEAAAARLRAEHDREVERGLKRVDDVLAKDRVPAVTPLTIAATQALLATVAPDEVLRLARTREEAIAARALGRITVLTSQQNERAREAAIARFEKIADRTETAFMDPEIRAAYEQRAELVAEKAAFTAYASKVVDVEIAGKGEVRAADMIGAGHALSTR